MIMSKPSGLKPWHLVADIGGTNARFARKACDSNALTDITRISVAGHENFIHALEECMEAMAKDSSWEQYPEEACFAVACRTDHDEISFTNSPWHFSRRAVSSALGKVRLQLINDFAAQGYAISKLGEDDWVQVGGLEPETGKPIAILGPGTGLGVSLVVPAGQSFSVVDGEGGHVDFAPLDDDEYAVLNVLKDRFGRVSVERLLSGSGILNIYQALCLLGHKNAVQKSPEEISEAALHATDGVAVETLHMFCRVLGSVAGNVALTAGTRGGVYITGGIVPAMRDFFINSGFRQRFEDKGRFSDYLGTIPVRLVINETLGLVGAANRLAMASW